ncbi:hypothetical protein KAR52_02465 [Candidatus Pacearchaeota archaeon]|nr:hypothetical protein [Candidatus Pacearchaeota archaeon]
MKKIFIILGIGIILLMLTGVFAESPKSSDEFKDFINEIKEKKEITDEEILSVTEIGFDELPSEINLGDIADNSIAIYQMEYGEDKPTFVLTAKDPTEFKEPVSISADIRQLLHFGFNGEMTESGFLQTATGISSEGKGYVMMRSGSITGISTILETNETASEKIEIIIYKNGEPIGFRNTLNIISGIQKDYDLQSKNIVTFNPGDVISVSAKTSENTLLKDIITMVEITI